MKPLTTENASSQQIVVAYTKLFSNSSDWFIKQLAEIKTESFDIDNLAETIKKYCCGQNEFSNLCLNLDDSLHRLIENDVSHSNQDIVRSFNAKLFSARKARV